jgi:hypothetical protein
MSDSTPAEREATQDETIEVEWLGQTVHLPATPEDWDINVTRAFAKGDLITAIEELVGAAAFRRIEKAHRAKHGGKFRNADLKPLGDKIAETYGFENQG